jgi:hypothetical protein
MRALVLLLLSALPCLAQTYPSPGPGTVNNHSGGTCGSGPSWSHTQATAVATGGAVTSLNVVLTNNPATGHTVYIGVVDAASVSRTFTVKDANNNAYTVTPSSPNNSRLANAGEVGIAYLLSAPANASKTITVTWSGVLIGANVYADEFTDANSCTRSFDTDAVANAGIGSPNAPSITPGQANELFYSVVSGQDNMTVVNAPWTGTISASGDAAGYILNRSTAAAVNYTQNSSTNWVSIEAAIK